MELHRGCHRKELTVSCSFSQNMGVLILRQSHSNPEIHNVCKIYDIYIYIIIYHIMYIFWWKLNSSGSMHIFHQPPNSGIVWTWLERFPYLILHQTTIATILTLSTPTTTNTVPKNAGLENDISSKTSDVHWFSGFILVFRGVDPLIVFIH